MSVLTHEMQEGIVRLLVDEGLADGELVKSAQEEAVRTKSPVLATLISKRIINTEMVARATAMVTGVPYVELKNIQIDQEILLHLTQDVAERSMVVPIGEKNGGVVIAMLDVSNVQTMDYLTRLTQKQIYPVMSSEEGIRYALSQYRADFSSVKQAVRHK